VYSELRFVCRICVLFLLSLLALSHAGAQQTLGGISGTVTDASGSVIQGVAVKVVEDGTGLTRTVQSTSSGGYSFPDLPIGTYTVTFTRDGFSVANFPGIVVQSDRTINLPAQMAVGAASESVTVNATPLMNQEDTTNGYVVDKAQIDETPLPTGSFTGLAILSPGVNAELPGGTGVNSGLGNAPIWANGQRDTSNSFLLNGVDASNLFNGKSTSQVASARVVNSTGEGNSGAGGVEQSSASVYLSIGNAIPTPAPETIQEIRVNTSMYEAEQGSTSGAHIDLSTSSGTNDFHGSAYIHRGTSWLNAAPFFFKQDADVPANDKVPQLHRYILGGTLGGPIIKDKVFGFIAYQHLHVSDQEIGDSFFDVPFGLSDTNRTPGGLAGVVNSAFPGTFGAGAATAVDPVAVALFNAPAVAGEPGKWLIPNPTVASISDAHSSNAFLPGTARFIADQVVADLDYNATAKDTVALKYYYQHDPTVAPYAYSSVPGFDQHLDAGSQVFSVNNTYLVKSNLSTQETFAFLREKIYSDNDQPFAPASLPGQTYGAASINTFGSTYFPGVTVYDALGSNKLSGVGDTLNIGPNGSSQGSNTGVFQNRLEPSGNALWQLGRHNVGFGGSYSYTQLNTIDKRTGTGVVTTADLSQFAQGIVTPNYAYNVTTFLQGDASRYFRANQLGLYAQDKFQIKQNLTLTAGIRYDWDGGLTEKYGRIFNFDPSLYSYSDASDTLSNAGFIIAGNNANGTAGVSNTTLTGRQWGIAPRVGVAWEPEMFHSKVVVRTGAGIYYDRGELFTYFSPGYAIGDVTGGPFGVNQSLPFVTAQTCLSTPAGQAAETFYFGYIPTCGGTNLTGNLENPFGSVLTPAPVSPKASDLSKYLPNAAAIMSGAAPVSLGVYDRDNKLPYTVNYTLDVQWQPRNDVAIELGYVGNLGRHQVIPVPLNQPGIASPGAPIHGQKYSYGYTPLSDPSTFTFANLPDGTSYMDNYEGGNVDLRVPYIGYAAESIGYKAAGVDAYNAFIAHVDKRLSHGFSISASYTYSHALDEQSGLGLFYNGNNALDLRDGYASSDFDRKHVVNFNYVYALPEFASNHALEGYFTNGWSFVGQTVLQSGQPYSVIDYSGGVGSVYYSVYDGITNPIVPLAPGCTAKSAKTGTSGAFGTPALKASCFTVPTLAAGSAGGGIPSNDPYETGFTNGQRNIFRQAAQKRADISLIKATKFKERYDLKYTFDVFNLTNTTSFDIPGDNVSQNQYYNQFPAIGQPVLPTNNCTTNGNGNNNGFYNCPGGLGYTEHTIGSPRQIQMSLHLLF
jgi:hypothetical protein